MKKNMAASAHNNVPQSKIHWTTKAWLAKIPPSSKPQQPSDPQEQALDDGGKAKQEKDAQFQDWLWANALGYDPKGYVARKQRDRAIKQRLAEETTKREQLEKELGEQAEAALVYQGEANAQFLEIHEKLQWLHDELALLKANEQAFEHTIETMQTVILAQAGTIEDLKAAGKSEATRKE